MYRTREQLSKVLSFDGIHQMYKQESSLFRDKEISVNKYKKYKEHHSRTTFLFVHYYTTGQWYYWQTGTWNTGKF